VADQLQDGRSISRLAAARNAVIQALQRLPCGSQIGISIFASRRTLLLLAPVEVCANRVELAQAIGQVDARMAWEDASVIVRGIYSATDVAFELPQHPSVVFLTDGQESPPMASIPEFDRPAGRVQGLVLGVGGDTPQPIPHLDKQGRQRGWWSAAEVVQRPTPAGFGIDQEHLSALHEQHLRGVAAAAGLRYARLQDPSGLLDLLTDPRLTRALVVATDLRWLPGCAALLLLALYFLPTPLRRWQRLQHRLRELRRQRRRLPAARPRQPHS
jgi:mxaL protein